MVVGAGLTLVLECYPQQMAQNPEIPSSASSSSSSEKEEEQERREVLTSLDAKKH